MIQLILNLLMNLAMAATLESGCLQLDTVAGTFSNVENGKCTTAKFDADFVIRGFEGDDYFSLNQVPSLNLFCEMNIDRIVHTKGAKSQIVWDSEKKFREIVDKTAFVELIRFNSAKSLPGKKVCEPFPDFRRIRQFKKNDLPDSLGELSQGGYIAMPEFATTIFFFNKKFDKIDFAKNVSMSVDVVDSLILTHGELLLITKEYTRTGSTIYCLENWDILSGFKIHQDCSIDKTDNQIFVQNGQNVLRLVEENDKITAVEFPGKKKLWSVKKPLNFNLTKAFLD